MNKEQNFLEKSIEDFYKLDDKEKKTKIIKSIPIKERYVFGLALVHYIATSEKYKADILQGQVNLTNEFGEEVFTFLIEQQQDIRINFKLKPKLKESINLIQQYLYA